MYILVILILLLVLYYFYNQDKFEHLALQKVSRGLVTTSRSGVIDSTTTFSDYKSECIGGEGKKRFTAFSPVDNATIIANTVDPIYGKPTSVEKINNRNAPVWLKDDPSCPVDGLDGPYEQWGPCSVPCGSGVQTRTMTCARQSRNNGKPCSFTVDKQPCNTNPCPIDGVDGGWSEWSSCSKSCGTGTSSRSLTCLKEPLYGGKPCLKTVETKPCNTTPCSSDAIDGPFGEWGACSKPCDGGIKTRTMTCTKEGTFGGKMCLRTVETQPCNTQKCSVDGINGPFGEWSTCSKSCGGGTRTRTMTCAREAEAGGKPCLRTVETENCNTNPCSQDAIEGEFGEWTTCSKPCGGGSQTRKKACIKEGQNGGKMCSNAIETQPCNTQNCPVDAVEGTFGEWSPCTAKCGGGKQERKKTCIKDALYGGKPCSNAIETQACNTQTCYPTFVLTTGSTPWNDIGGGNSIYIDRHDIACPSKSALKQLRFSHQDYKQIHYDFTCAGGSDFGDAVGSSTPANDWGGGNTVFFDRHNLECPSESAISQMRLTRPRADQISFAYRCSQVPGLTSCEKTETPWNAEGNGVSIYLDRHNVNCPENNLLTQMKLERDGKGNYRYKYTCCGRTASIPADPAPVIPIAQYARVNTAGGYLNLTEVKVFSGETNIAKGKSIHSSATPEYAPGYGYEKLVDDNVGTLAHSQGAGKEWVVIDFGSMNPVTKIEVHNRPDCCQGRIVGGFVELLDQNKNVVWKSEPFKSKTGGTVPMDHPDTSGFAIYTMTLPSTVVTGHVYPLDGKTYLLKHQQDGKCMDGDGSKLYYSNCDQNSPSQQFKFSQGYHGGYNLQQISVNKCLDGNGSSIYYGPCQPGNGYQNWLSTGESDNLLKHAVSQKCLDGNGSSFYFGPCDAKNPYQNWIKVTKT